MKRRSLAVAFLAAAIFTACGAGDAGRWVVTASLRTAYGCSLMISSDQAADPSALAERPAPLVIDEASVALAPATPEKTVVLAGTQPTRESESVEIAELPISRDITSIRPAGTRKALPSIRLASVRRPVPFRFYVPRPEPAPAPTTICRGAKG